MAASKKSKTVVPWSRVPVEVQRRAIERFIERNKAILKEEYPGLESLSYGIRVRKGKLGDRTMLVLKCIVSTKEEDPDRPLPSHFEDRVTLPRTAHRKKSRSASVRIPTDVIEVKTGRATGPAASIRAHHSAGKDRGCLAARVSWRDGDRAWLGAAHVVRPVRLRSNAAAPEIRVGNRKLGHTARETCWVVGDGTHEVDVGLVIEEDATTSDLAWVAGALAQGLDNADMPTASDSYDFVNQDGHIRPLRWHTWLPAGTVRLDMGGGRMQVYPRVAHFFGSVRQGDSGTCVRRWKDRKAYLAGVLVGEVTADEPGPIVITFEDIQKLYQRAFGHQIQFRPTSQ